MKNRTLSLGLVAIAFATLAAVGCSHTAAAQRFEVFPRWTSL